MVQPLLIPTTKRKASLQVFSSSASSNAENKDDNLRISVYIKAIPTAKFLDNLLDALARSSLQNHTQNHLIFIHSQQNVFMPANQRILY